MKKISAKKETDTDILARQIAEGFGEMNQRFNAVDERFDAIDKRFDGVDNRFGAVEYRLLSLEKGQTETHRRLEVIERKQMGMLHSLDQTVHQSEFRKLVHRVEALEK